MGLCLHVANTDRISVSEGVGVLNLALECDGYRLKPPVRVLPHAQPLGRRREVLGSRVVQQEEGRHGAAEGEAAEDGVHMEAITNPVCARLRQHLDHALRCKRRRCQRGRSGAQHCGCDGGPQSSGRNRRREKLLFNARRWFCGCLPGRPSGWRCRQRVRIRCW